MKLLGGNEEEFAVVKALIGANTDNFIKALDLINAEYGSMDAYLRNALGLTDKDFEILRERYLCLEVQVIETELLKENELWKLDFSGLAWIANFVFL